MAIPTIETGAIKAHISTYSEYKTPVDTEPGNNAPIRTGSLALALKVTPPT
jgi:hypothetical protein